MKREKDWINLKVRNLSSLSLFRSFFYSYTRNSTNCKLKMEVQNVPEK